MTILQAALLLFSLTSLQAPAYGGEGELEIGRMRVAIWPEYDSSGVLFIYDGRFKDEGTFPVETSFYIPKGAIISDVCSLSPKGTHFCQLYKKSPAGDVDEVKMKLPYPNFYLSFHTEPFTDGAEKRVFEHLVKANHLIESLEVDLQIPLRAEGFNVISPQGLTTSEKKGFTHLGGTFEGMERGQTLEVKLEYVKKDSRPSVDIKYSPMGDMKMEMAGGAGGGGPAARAAPYNRQKRARGIIYAAAGAGVFVLAGLMYAILRKKK
ncbi:MAG: hypothetical protein V3W31_08250 [Thermodesulfobacteriota bacterium]